ncbi:MAG: hypothetical protein EB168_06430 [Euryarchaeota archaeon]|nr:hypothetical protein [Euryarchaeota archaeon]
MGQDSPHISTHGTCTNCDLLSISPLMPLNGNRIMLRSTQKNVLLGLPSGRNLTVDCEPSLIFQCG